MKSSDVWEKSQKAGRIDWTLERDRVDLAAVVANLLGSPASKKEGRRLLWRCPFHDDHYPSFVVDPERKRWGCYPCGIGGDAASLVMRINGVTFPEAVAILTGGPIRTRKAAPRPATKPTSKPPPDPSGLPDVDALSLVKAAEARLWSSEGELALAYLTGPDRRLSHETIRAARLGWTPGVSVPTRDGDRYYQALGIVIPWFNGDRLAKVNVRQPDGRRPKYAEAFRDPSIFVCYPSPAVIRPGQPLVVVEGEFDALALREALVDLATVVTLGGASARPGTAALRFMLAASQWFIATDRDEAGDKSAKGWPVHARRVRPPGTYKDWTEAKVGGVNLLRWWQEILTGNDRPPLFTWDDLSQWRWGGADDTPGIIINKPPLEHRQ